VEETFGYVNLDWREYVTEGPRYRRPTEVPLLQTDPFRGQATPRVGAYSHIPRSGPNHDGRRSRGRGPIRARAGDTVPDRWSTGVAQEAVKHRVRELLNLCS